jgi:flagellar basal body L-ring protein FlgH
LVAKPLIACTLTGAMLLAACSAPDDTPQNQVSATEMPAPAEAGSVTRNVIEPEQPPVQPMAAAAVIQSQPGPGGSQVDLLKAAVTGDILTVTLRCSSSERINSESFRVSDISVIDDATSQRISVLKDNEGKWMASNVSGDNLGTSCEQKPGIIWAKFPAPPATSKTISINLPEVAPFDGVPVTR